MIILTEENKQKLQQETEKEEVQETEKEGLNEASEDQKEAAVELTLEQMQQLLDSKTAEAEENYNRLLRTQADFDNYRRRTKEEREQLIKYASESLIIELLPVLDNFDRALGAADTPGDDFAAGVKMIHRQLMEVLNKEGLEEIAAEGKEFDPMVHEAMMQVESDEHSENTVVEELRKGYTLKGKVIRPSLVKVAK
ncbi:nucleotide exchange factor GrpE [Desulfofalx alkaliphila]|uniref:nucleotide exchange factor GrpE n=1 Tax=Desulfofalx alkaliphila TaxID=105483 RepID=UPI003B75CCAE